MSVVVADLRARLNLFQIASSYPPATPNLLAELITRIRSAQLRAAFAVSRELVLLCWSIGREILAWQQAEGWGDRPTGRRPAERVPRSRGLQPP